MKQTLVTAVLAFMMASQVSGETRRVDYPNPYDPYGPYGPGGPIDPICYYLPNSCPPPPPPTDPCSLLCPDGYTACYRPLDNSSFLVAGCCRSRGLIRPPYGENQ